MTYKIDSGTDGNLIPIKIFKWLYPKAKIELLYTSKNNSVILRPYNSSNIEQLVICPILLKHKDKVTRCRFL